MDSRPKLARLGEAAVADWLEARGYRVIARNARVGRLELDLVARRGRLLVVCEVRSRRHRRLVDPIETIDARKVERVRRAAAGWLAAHRPGTSELRFDAASVSFDGPGGAARITYYADAF